MPKKEFDLSQLVKDFVLKGNCTTTIDVIKDEIGAEIINLSSEDQLQIEKELSQSTEGPAAILHGFSLAILSRVLKIYNDKDVESVEDARSLLGQLPGVVIDYMISQQQAFEHAISKALTGKEINNTFFETEPTSTDSKPE
jgi:hypothetical protein